jgi:pilus assembly protein Flp/PilA
MVFHFGQGIKGGTRGGKMVNLRVRRLLRREEGQDLAEYALLFALIALVAVGAVTLLGNDVMTAFNNLAAAMGL